ncbi:MAG: helix-hairpin-helix domain-containing protein, partial [Elusimicrobiota bacterium]
IGRSVEISTPTVSGTVDISTPTLSETIEPSTPTITETPPPQQQKLTEETKPVAPEPAAPKLDIEKIFRVTESISQAESNGPGAVDTWINLLYQPMDINKVTVDDLMSIPSVTPIDAYNVVKTRRKKGAFFSIDEIGSVPNISRYGNYSIRDYCVVQEKERVTQLSGVYRFSWTGVRYYGRISDEDEVPSLSQGNYAVFPVHKIQIRYGENVFAGAMSSEVFFKEKNQNDTSKVYAGVRNLPLLGGKFNIDRLYFGNYYLSLGQGLIMENSNDFSPRRYQRVQGIFGDISAGTIGSDSLDSGSFSGLYKLTGMAFQTTISKRLQIIYFYASDKRDGIMNPDGTINYYFSDVIRKDSIKNKFNENIAGYNFRLNILGEAGYVGITKFTSQTDKAFNSDPNFLAAYNRADFLTATVPEYNGLYKGNSREISGYDFRTVFQNFAFSGEFANQKDGGSASILRFDAQIRGFALTGLWRDYATNYDNPFNRAFAEYSKFNDSILEKDYDLFDEYYAALPAAVPQPKGEKGLYMKIYLPLTRNLTINRLEYDNWQQYEYDSRTDRTNLARSYRKDAEIAYRLSRGVRISLREKQYSMDPDNQDDLTTESQVRLRVTRYPKSFQLKYFYRNKSYRVSPQDRYTHTREAGSYVSGDVTHYLTSTISLTARLLLWNTSPGSWLWDIEDTLPFDYMNRTGMKYYLIIKDQVADNLSIRIKFRNKITYKEYAVEPNALTYGKYYMYDIQNSRDNIYDFKFQIDYSF